MGVNFSFFFFGLKHQFFYTGLKHQRRATFLVNLYQRCKKQTVKNYLLVILHQNRLLFFFVFLLVPKIGYSTPHIQNHGYSTPHIKIIGYSTPHIKIIGYSTPKQFYFLFFLGT